MNEQHFQLLKTLKEACSEPVVGQTADERLKEHLADMEIVVSHLLVELATVPQLKQLALQEYLTAARNIEVFLSARKASPDTVRSLARLAASDDPAQFEACLATARELQLELHNIGGPETGAWEKQLALVEGNYGQRILDALASQLSPPRIEQPASGAGQTKNFDEGKLSDFFVKSFPEEPGIRIAESKFISGGSSKYTMGIQLAGVNNLPEAIVLRGDSASSANFGGASAVDEFRLLTVLHDHGVCVPRPLAVETSGEVFGTPFMLVEKRPGNTIGHMFKLPKPNQAIGRDIAEKLANIHRVPTSAIGDRIKGAKVSTSDQVAATLAESFTNWQALQRPSAVFETAFKWLRDNVDIMNRSRGLVHGDYGLNNLLIDGDKVSAILDWEYAHIGNPAYDLGYFYYQAMSLASWQEFLDAYQNAGAKLPSPEELDYSILFAATRLGVMVCQAEAAYRAGIAGGLFMSLISGRYTHQMSIVRISDILRRIL